MGKIIGSHGVKGWLKIHPFTEEIETLTKYDEWLIPRNEKTWDVIKVDQTIVKEKIMLVKLNEVNDRNSSDNFIKSLIGVQKKDLPDLGPNDYYWSDLIGLCVESEDGVMYGVVETIMETGSNDVMIVKGEKEILIPYLPDVILNIDLVKKKIIVDWDENY